jgi:putative nucleotidyltransferase with HDIG domain
MARRQVLHFYIAALCVGAVLLLMQSGFDMVGDRSRFWNTFGILLGIGLLTEVFALQVRVGTLTSSVSFIPYLSAVILLGPAWAMLIAGATELFAETVIRRKPLIKIVHNTSKEIVAVGSAGYLYLLAGGVVSSTVFVGAFNPPAFLATALMYFLISAGAVATAVTLSTRTEIGDAWKLVGGKRLTHDVLSSSISVLLAFLYIEAGVLGLLLVIVPLFFVRHAVEVAFQLELANRELLELMVKSIEARDPYTSGHSLRVAAYAKAIARSLGLSAKEIEQIETAALLHDVGKIYEEFARVLRKEGPLTEEERVLMRTHPVRSAELVGTISSLHGYVVKCVRAHHEHFDGGGYPDGLAEGEIPIGARIIMVADTADAMMTDRPYREALSYEQVVGEFEKFASSQFDPEVVRAFRQSTAIRRLIDERRPVVAGESSAQTLQSVVGSVLPATTTLSARGKWRHRDTVRR